MLVHSCCLCMPETYKLATRILENFLDPARLHPRWRVTTSSLVTTHDLLLLLLPPPATASVGPLHLWDWLDSTTGRLGLGLLPA